MKKIEEKMISAINAGKNANLGNTTVTHFGQSVYIELYGNLICIINKNTGKKIYNLCGWNTVTTRSRLNALGAGVRCKNFAAVNWDGSELIPASGADGKRGFFIAKY